MIFFCLIFPSVNISLWLFDVSIEKKKERKKGIETESKDIKRTYFCLPACLPGVIYETVNALDSVADVVGSLFFPLPILLLLVLLYSIHLFFHQNNVCLWLEKKSAVELVEWQTEIEGSGFEHM